MEEEGWLRAEPRAIENHFWTRVGVRELPTFTQLHYRIGMKQWLLWATSLLPNLLNKSALVIVLMLVRCVVGIWERPVVSLVSRSLDWVEMHLRNIIKALHLSSLIPAYSDLDNKILYFKWCCNGVRHGGDLGREGVCFSMGRIWIKGARRWPVELAPKSVSSDSSSLVFILLCSFLPHWTELTKLGHERHWACHLCLSDHMLWRSQLPCCKDMQATLWRGPDDRDEMFPANSQRELASPVNKFSQTQILRIRHAFRFLPHWVTWLQPKPPLNPWPTNTKIINIYCWFKLLSLGIVRYTAITNTYFMPPLICGVFFINMFSYIYQPVSKLSVVFHWFLVCSPKPKP